MTPATTNVQFISSYRGSATYRVIGSYDRHGCLEEIEVRYRAYDDGYYNGNVFETDILPAVGTVKRYHCSDEWPSDKACAAFPTMIPARWNSELHRFEYRGNRRPAITQDQFGYTLMETA